MTKKITFLILFTIALSFSYAQTGFKFAHISDTHIGSSNAEEDLRRTVQSINNDSTIKFVILSGDITDFGSDAQRHIGKKILDNLNKTWYINPSNHDTK